jgi:hypothetical protein
VTDENDKNNEEKISDETTKEIAYKLPSLNQNKVEIQSETKVIEVKDKNLKVVDIWEGKQRIICGKWWLGPSGDCCENC